MPKLVLNCRNLSFFVVEYLGFDFSTKIEKVILLEFLTKEYNFPSTSGLCDIFAQSAAPIDYGSIKGVVQISHGMAEYSNRYS